MIGTLQYRIIWGISCIFLMTVCSGCSQTSDGPQNVMPPVAVETLKVGTDRIEETIRGVGSILANESVVIKPEVSGKVISIGFIEGEHVNKGQVLFRLDTELIEAEYEEVKANLDYYRVQYERAKNLKKSLVMPDEKYDDTYREYLNAQARAETLGTRIKKYTIDAPFYGVVGVRYVSIGDYVAIGEELVSLEDIATMKVEFYLPERFHSRIKTGQPVSVAVESFDEIYTGLINLINPRLHAETRSIIVRAQLDNPGEVLKPGMFSKVKVIIDSRDNAIVIPRKAILSRGERQYVFVNNRGVAEMRPITPGIFSGARTEVLTGLNSGDIIITEGMQKLMPGAKLLDQNKAKIP